MSNFYKWNGGTTQRDGLMLRPGQIFDAEKYPVLDINSELETGRVSEAGSDDRLTFVSPDELAHQQATLANREALKEAAAEHKESIAVLQSALKSGEVDISRREKQLREGFEQLKKERSLLESEKQAFELQKKSTSKKSKKGGSR